MPSKKAGPPPVKRRLPRVAEPLTIAPTPKVRRTVNVQRAVQVVNRGVGAKVVRVSKKPAYKANVKVKPTPRGTLAFGILGSATVPSNAREGQRRRVSFKYGDPKVRREHPTRAANQWRVTGARRTITTIGVRSKKKAPKGWVIPPTPKQEVRTLAHEIGHTLGLEHSKKPGRLMTQTSKGGGKKLTKKEAQIILWGRRRILTRRQKRATPRYVVLRPKRGG